MLFPTTSLLLTCGICCFFTKDGEGNICPKARLLLPAISAGNFLFLQNGQYCTQQNRGNHGVFFCEDIILFSPSYSCSTCHINILFGYFCAAFAPRYTPKSRSAPKLPAWLGFLLYQNITRFLKCLNEAYNLQEEKQCHIQLWLTFSIIQQII